MAKGVFSREGDETYNPEYGGILWKPSLNNFLEKEDITMRPIFYREGEYEKIQVTQENTFIYLNSFVDCMDCVVIDYERVLNIGELATYHYRDAHPKNFDKMTRVIGEWSLLHMTVYPLEEIVENYMILNKPEDFVPDDIMGL